MPVDDVLKGTHRPMTSNEIYYKIAVKTGEKNERSLRRELLRLQKLGIIEKIEAEATHKDSKFKMIMYKIKESW